MRIRRRARRCAAHGRSRTARRPPPVAARRRHRRRELVIPGGPDCVAPPRPTPAPPRRPTYRHTTKLLTDESIAKPADRALAEGLDYSVITRYRGRRRQLGGRPEPNGEGMPVIESSVAAMLRERASLQPDDAAFTFID